MPPSSVDQQMTRKSVPTRTERLLAVAEGIIAGRRRLRPRTPVEDTPRDVERPAGLQNSSPAVAPSGLG
jgi:hypothetical protein